MARARKVVAQNKGAPRLYNHQFAQKQEWSDLNWKSKSVRAAKINLKDGFINKK